MYHNLMQPAFRFFVRFSHVFFVSKCCVSNHGVEEKLQKIREEKLQEEDRRSETGLDSEASVQEGSSHDESEASKKILNEYLEEISLDD